MCWPRPLCPPRAFKCYNVLPMRGCVCLVTTLPQRRLSVPSSRPLGQSFVIHTHSLMLPGSSGHCIHWWRRPRYSAAVGMISYSAKCAEQLMSLEGSPMGESLRKAMSSQAAHAGAGRGENARLSIAQTTSRLVHICLSSERTISMMSLTTANPLHRCISFRVKVPTHQATLARLRTNSLPHGRQGGSSERVRVALP